MTNVYNPPKVERYIFNRFNMPLLIEIEGKPAVMLEAKNYLRLDDDDIFLDSTSRLFSMGHLVIIANNR